MSQSQTLDIEINTPLNKPQERKSKDIQLLTEIQNNLPQNSSERVSRTLNLLIQSLSLRTYQAQRLKQIKFIDKLTFTFTLCSMLLNFFLLGFSPTKYFIMFYTFCVCMVFVYRIFVWPLVSRNSLYLLEFCYYANLLSLYFFHVAPYDPRVWYMMWTSNAGLIALAAVLFRNMTAFSSFDQMLGMYLHALPPLACYVVRWHTNDQWGLLKPMIDFKAMIIYGLIFYACWVVYYQFMIGCVFYSVIEKGEWCSMVKDLKQLKDKSPYGQRFYLMLMHIGIYLIGFFVSLIIYQSQIANQLYLICIYIIITWNGACYYIDHFSLKYQKNIEEASYKQAQKMLDQQKP